MHELRNITAVIFFGYTVQLTEKYAEAKNYTADLGGFSGNADNNRTQHRL